MIRNSRRGFTLIEILVVIVIIALLAALLFPAIARASKKGQQAGCIGNVRQITMALTMYANDHQGNFPARESVWADLRLPTGVYRCPSKGMAKYTYSYNWRVAEHNISEFALPNVLTLITDGKRQDDRLYSEFLDKGDIEYLHDGRTVAGFLDGHVAACYPSQVEVTYPGGDIDGRQGILDAYGIQIANKKPMRLHIINKPSKDYIEKGEPFTWPCANGSPSQCSEDYISQFIDTFSGEISLLPAHLFHTHDDEDPQPGTKFPMIYLLDDIAPDRDYLYIWQGNDDPDYLDFDYSYGVLGIDIDHAGKDIEMITDPVTGVVTHQHKLLTPEEIDIIIFEHCLLLPDGPADTTTIDQKHYNSRHEKRREMAKLLTKLFRDPENTIANPSTKSEVKALRDYIEKIVPEMDDEYWHYIAQVRGRKSDHHKALTITEPLPIEP